MMASVPITSLQIDGEKVETVKAFIFLGFKITVDGDCSPEIRRHLLHGRKTMTNLDSVLKHITLPTKVRIVKAMVFPVVMYRCKCWTIKRLRAKNGCFQTVMLEKTLESPLDSKEIKPVNLEGKQPWIFNWCWSWSSNTWSPDAKSRLIGKDPDAGKDWRQEKKGTAEDEMIGWHHWLNGHEFEQALGDGEGQGSLVCCSSWGCKEPWLNDWPTTTNIKFVFFNVKVFISLCFKNKSGKV